MRASLPQAKKEPGKLYILFISLCELHSVFSNCSKKNEHNKIFYGYDKDNAARFHKLGEAVHDSEMETV